MSARAVAVVGAAAVALPLAAAACKPDLDNRTSRVSSARLLAVRADPPEAPAGAPVTYTALVAAEQGVVADPHLAWASCSARKALAELGPVSPECMQASGDALHPFGAGATATAPVPADACRTFGPEVPTPVKGEPTGRPVDPDATGGYYVPIRVLETDTGALDLVAMRVSCGVAGANADQIADYQKRYHPNVSPVIDALTVDGAAAPAPIAAGAHVTLRATWAACGADPGPCTGAETYVAFDLASRSIVTQKEALRVAWYANGGALDVDANGVASGDPATFVENGFVAPAEAGKVEIWVVIRDDRGGTSWGDYMLDVR